MKLTTLLVITAASAASLFAQGLGSATKLRDLDIKAQLVCAGDSYVLTWVEANNRFECLVPTSPAGTGTVINVGMTVPAEFSVAGSPVTTAGTFAVTKATQTANRVWAGPTTGAAAQPAFRALVSADIPNNAANTAGNAGTATAAAANPTNCTSGQLPRGVDAAWAGEGCAAVSLTADVSGSLPTANMATAARIRPCEIIIGDPGAASAVLADDNDGPYECGNVFTATLTITAVECRADGGTPTVTPIITGGSGTSILSGALTCGVGSFASGTLNGTPTQTSGQSIDGNITVAGGTAKYLVIRITRTL